MRSAIQTNNKSSKQNINQPKANMLSGLNQQISELFFLSSKIPSRSPLKKSPINKRFIQLNNSKSSKQIKNTMNAPKNRQQIFQAYYPQTTKSNPSNPCNNHDYAMDENTQPNQASTNIYRQLTKFKNSKFVPIPEMLSESEIQKKAKELRIRPSSIIDIQMGNSVDEASSLVIQDKLKNLRDHIKTEGNIEDSYQQIQVTRSKPPQLLKIPIPQPENNWNEEYDHRTGNLARNQSKKISKEKQNKSEESIEPPSRSRVQPSPKDQENYHFVSKPIMANAQSKKTTDDSISNNLSNSSVSLNITKHTESRYNSNEKVLSGKSIALDQSKKVNSMKAHKTLIDSISNTKSGQSTCSTNSGRPTAIEHIFDHHIEKNHIPNEETTPFECEEQTVIGPCNQTANYDSNSKSEKQQQQQEQQINDKNIELICEEMVELIPMSPTLKQGLSMEIEPQVSTRLSLDEEIKQFEQNIILNDIWLENFQSMIEDEQYYTPDPFYFKFKQRELNPLMRSILIDWMMEVSSEFFLKRETLYMAINYVDRYLSNSPNVQKWDLQLVGLTAMLISSKMEEVYPHKIRDFAKSADDGYTIQQILDMELKMNQVLNWRLTPATIFTWANWYMVEWDNFLDTSQIIVQARLINNNPNNELIHFKYANRESYTKYRELMQMLDCSILNIESLQYKNRALVASFLYLIIGKYYKQFTLSEIIHEIPVSSCFLFNDTQGLNYIFKEFLRLFFGYQLEDLLPTIQYAAKYFSLPISYELPHAAKADPDNVLKGHYEEFLCYQTHCASNLKYTKSTQRK